MNPLFAPKTYAHIYNAPKKQVRLMITTGPAIDNGVISEQLVDTKKEAKKLAKDAGATPYNY